jgi:hypothetical protein
MLRLVLGIAVDRHPVGKISFPLGDVRFLCGIFVLNQRRKPPVFCRYFHSREIAVNNTL